MVHWWEPWLRRRWPSLSEAWVRGLCLALLLACILPTNIKLLVDGALSESGSVPTGWMQAFEWVRAHTPADTRLMTSDAVGNFAAPFALRRVYVGHAQQTIDHARKIEEARAFYNPDTPGAERLEILRKSGCDYVLADASQRAALQGWSALREVFRTPDMSVYRLALPGGSASPTAEKR